jgi:TDG/mug DNA glycosylase family protein
MTRPPRPSRADLVAAAGKTVADVIAPGLDVLFVGINPGLYTAAIGHHFGRPGNRFWPVLHAAGFTPRLLSPYDEQELLGWRLGITNLIARATARADELGTEELVAGAEVLREKLRRYAPRFVAFLGVTAYRTALARPGAKTGRQADSLVGCVVWVLPNPSGLNAHYQAGDLARLFAELRAAVEGQAG